MQCKILLPFFKKQWLTIATFASVVLGVIVGCILRSTTSLPWSERDRMYLNFIGEIFMRMLKCLILPLMASSILTAIGSLDLRLSKKIGIRAVSFYLTTTFFAVVLGIILVVTIQPGVHDKNEEDLENNNKPSHTATTTDTLLDLVRNLFPANVVQACTELHQTNLVKQVNNSSNDISTWKIEKDRYVHGLNIMGVVVVSVIFGIATSVLSSDVKDLIAIIRQFDKVIMKLTRWVILLSPVGVFFLTTGQVVEMGDLAETMRKLGMYIMTVVVGLLIQGIVILPIIYFVATRKNPYRFIAGLAQALITGLAQHSELLQGKSGVVSASIYATYYFSSGTLPVTIQCLVEKNGVDRNLAKFMIPIGTVINLDGTALYEAVPAIFIGQYYGIEFTIGKVIAVSITATAAAIGAAGIPSAGLVTLMMVLEAVGTRTDNVGLIMSVDWFLDRLRTVVNVMGDSFGVGIVGHMCEKDLEQLRGQADEIDTKFHMMHSNDLEQPRKNFDERNGRI